MRYIAKPYLFNNLKVKEFSKPQDAVNYLNEVLSEGQEGTEYSFTTPKVKKGKIQEAVQEYQWIGKLIIIDDEGKVLDPIL